MLFMYISITSHQNLSTIVRTLAQCGGPLSPFKEIFYKLHAMINRWEYKHHQACSIAAKMVKEPCIRDFLSRLSQALSVGTTISNFMKVEYAKFTITSQREFQSMIDRLRVLSDAYSAIITAGTVVSISMLITTMLMGSGSLLILPLIFIGIVTSASSLSFLMYSTGVKQSIINDLPNRQDSLKIISTLGRFICYLTIPFVLTLFLILNKDLNTPFSLIFGLNLSFIIPGILASSIGRIGLREIKKIKSLEEQYTIFIKVLGEASAIAGSLHGGLFMILHNDYGRLNPLIKKLVERIKLSLEKEISWIAFAGETGSRLIFNLTSILLKAIEIGSSLRETCYSLFEAANEDLVRRAKREQVANYLKGLIYPIQGTFVAILSLTCALMGILQRFAQYSTHYGNVVIVPSIDLSAIELFSFFIILSLIVINALSIYFIDGSNSFTFLSNLGSLFILAGVVGMLVKIFSINILGIFTQFESRLEGAM
ncbi:MAG: hypothetical protein RMJ31_00665 [Nitrososphaerota archaeon]|nr:hypothetical protein [Nitrososphaerales archaeon]MDW8044275.1 hypothetical protein [Nitrososphaerota archaeon]